MKKVLILLILASCTLVPLDDGEINKIDVSHLERVGAKGIDNDANNAENLNDARKQEDNNKLWIKNLKSKSTYAWIWDGKTNKYEKVDIEDGGDFKIEHSQVKQYFYFTKAFSDSEALYSCIHRIEGSSASSSTLVLKIKDQRVTGTYTNTSNYLDNFTTTILYLRSSDIK